MVRDIDEIITNPDSAKELFYYGDYFTKLKILNCPACPPEVAYLAVDTILGGMVLIEHLELNIVTACNIWRVMGATREAFDYLYERVKFRGMVRDFQEVQRVLSEQTYFSKVFPADMVEWYSLMGLIAHPYSWPHVHMEAMHYERGRLMNTASYNSRSLTLLATFFPKETSEAVFMGLALNPKVTNDVKQKLLKDNNSLKLRHCFEVNPASNTPKKRLQEILNIYRNKCNLCIKEGVLNLSKIIIAHVLAHPNGRDILLSACLGGYGSLVDKLVNNMARAVAKYEGPWQAVIHYNDSELIPF